VTSLVVPVQTAVTADGIEHTFALNHLAPFLAASRLWQVHGRGNGDVLSADLVGLNAAG
jgi:hypothetical protein